MWSYVLLHTMLLATKDLSSLPGTNTTSFENLPPLKDKTQNDFYKRTITSLVHIVKPLYHEFLTRNFFALIDCD